MGVNLTNKAIQDTYEGLVQISGSLLTDGTGSLIDNLDVSASFATSASHATFAETAGGAVDVNALYTASISDATIAFLKGGGSTFNIEVNNVSSSISASYATTATSASHAVNADSAISSSYATTASYAENASTPTLAEVLTAGNATLGGQSIIISGSGLTTRTFDGNGIVSGIAGGDYTIKAGSVGARLVLTGNGANTNLLKLDTNGIQMSGSIGVLGDLDLVGGVDIVGNLDLGGSGNSISGMIGSAIVVGSNQTISGGGDGGIYSGRGNTINAGLFGATLGGDGNTNSHNRSVVIGGAGLSTTKDDEVVVPSLVANSITASFASFQSASIGYLQSITGSAKIIGDAFIILNNNTPTERYAGLVVQDSGSTNNTASFEFDGQTNDWFYEYTDDGGATTEHGVALFGAEYSTKGSPSYPANNVLQKGDGGHHLLDSSITDDGTNVSVNANISASGLISASTYYGDGSNLTGISTTPFPYTGSADISGSVNVDGVMTSGNPANTATGEYSLTIGGGSGGANTNTGENSVIVGGYNHTIGNRNGNAIIGGANHVMSSAGNQSAIIGGSNNTMAQTWSVIAGGYDNTNTQARSFMGGGQSNSNSGDRSAVIAGQNNTCGVYDSGIFAGISNTTSQGVSVIVGGISNTNNKSNSFYGGIFAGKSNNITGNFGDNEVIIGGESNTIRAGESTYRGKNNAILGGSSNQITDNSTNASSSVASVILGGVNNDIRTDLFSGTQMTGSAILGGANHQLTHNRSVIIGGDGLLTTQDDEVVVPNLTISGSGAVLTFADGTTQSTAGGGGGSAFPFTGSAEISGSLEITGADNVNNIFTLNSSDIAGGSVLISSWKTDIDGLGYDNNFRWINSSTYGAEYEMNATRGDALFDMVVGSGQKGIVQTTSGDLELNSTTGVVKATSKFQVDENIMTGDVDTHSLAGNRAFIIGGQNNSSAQNNNGVIGGTFNTSTHASSVVIGGTSLSTSKANEVVVPSLSTNGAVVQNVEALSIVANVAELDASLGNLFTLTLQNGVNTEVELTNQVAGQTFQLQITNNATGAGTITFDSQFDFEGGIAFTATATTGAIDILTFVCFGGGNVQCVGAKNFS